MQRQGTSKACEGSFRFCTSFIHSLYQLENSITQFLFFRSQEDDVSPENDDQQPAKDSENEKTEPEDSGTPEITEEPETDKSSVENVWILDPFVITELRIIFYFPYIELQSSYVTKYKFWPRKNIYFL